MKRQHGFTLVELVIVIVLTGIVGAIVSMQLRPALQSYLAVTRRANLVSQADTAARRIVGDVRIAVPNSLSLQATPGGAGQCMEMVPTIDGGRYRFAPDTGSAGPGNVFDASAAPIKFDVLSSLTTAATGDMIVIGNDNPNDLYLGSSVSTIKVEAGVAGMGRSLVTLTGSPKIAGSYDGGRFVVVPAANQIVGYACVSPQLANGKGTGTLVRTVRTIGQNTPACSAGTQTLAANVSECSFVYRENEGATQQSGYLQLRLGLSDGGETATLTVGAHVENVP